jgi:Transposase domain (DUF772)/EvpB/VC_A0108, tail sheath N-terminal domain
MKPRERRDSGLGDLLRLRLDAILDLDHQLVALARKVDWGFLEKRFGEVYRDGPGQPPLPTRLMAGLTILKYTYDLSDEELCARWVENPYYQFFCGEEFFQHKLVLDRSSLTHWRRRMGEEKMNALFQESLSIAVKTDAVKPSELSEMIIDTTVEPKKVMFLTVGQRSGGYICCEGARWDQSPLFKSLYESEFGQLGGEPYGSLIGDYEFSHLPTDVQLLRDLSKVAGSGRAMRSEVRCRTNRRAVPKSAISFDGEVDGLDERVAPARRFWRGLAGSALLKPRTSSTMNAAT